MISYTTIFVFQFLYILLCAFQSLNVVHDKKRWVVCTSLFISCAHVGLYGSFIIKTVDILETGNYSATVLLIVSLWLGSALGSTLSIELHKRLRNDYT